MYTIGRLAQRANVNADSVRFYERQGLLFPATKTEAGYRLYTDDAVHRITFIKQAQRCGFTLAEVAGLLQMQGGDPPARIDGYRLAEEKQAEIRKTIALLTAMSEALSGLLATRADTQPDVAAHLDENPGLRALDAEIPGRVRPQSFSGTLPVRLREPRAPA